MCKYTHYKKVPVIVRETLYISYSSCGLKFFDFLLLYTRVINKHRQVKFLNTPDCTCTVLSVLSPHQVSCHSPVRRTQVYGRDGGGTRHCNPFHKLERHGVKIIEILPKLLWIWDLNNTPNVLDCIPILDTDTRSRSRSDTMSCSLY